jgi:hypothetical protein
MTHLVAESKAAAEAAIRVMQDAALDARERHARAELMRHMLLTAGKLRDQSRDAAMRRITDEWLAAWALERAAFPHVGAMETLSLAFLDYVRAPSDAADATLRAAWDAVERGFAESGIGLADRMAWRSFCAHGWWAEIRPAPPGEGRADRAWPARPFWDEGCPEQCR